MVDLLKVQEAVTAAHRNFCAAMLLDHNTHNSAILKYLDGFLDAKEPKSIPIAQCANRCRSNIIGFEKKFKDIESEVGFTLLNRDIIVEGAQSDAIGIILGDFSKHLDDLSSRLMGVRQKTPNESKSNSNSINDLMTFVEELGYAVALVEQLAADLAFSRLDAQQRFVIKYLRGKTRLESIQDVKSSDIVEILTEVMLASTELFGLVGPIKKALDIWDKRRAPRAGHQTGDADILFELDAIIDLDRELAEQVYLAIDEAKRRSDALRSRHERSSIKN